MHALVSRLPRLALLSLLALPIAAAATPPATTLLRIPGGAQGLGFDDIGYVAALDRIVVPAAQSGALVLIDPRDDALRVLPGITPAGGAGKGHDAGTTSASYGAGLLFASDHDAQALLAVNPVSGTVVARAALAAQPDYVRYVAPLRQVWVSEPHARQIERFAVSTGAHPALRRLGVIAVPGGPESLLIDAGTGMAYTNQWRDHTLAIPLRDPHVAARWPNTCTGSRGLALDAAQHTLFVGCQEGKVVALDLDANGRIIASAPVGAGVDIIAWNPLLRHLYAPGAISATMTVLGYDGHGFTTRASVPTAAHAHCVATDERHQAYVCDPGAGALLVYRDPR